MWRGLKTAFVWLFLFGAATIQFGKALLAGVDQTSNVYAVGEYFEKARKTGTGTVNAGNVILFLFGAVGATIITLLIWRRGPFKVLAESVPVSLKPPTETHASENSAVPPSGTKVESLVGQNGNDKLVVHSAIWKAVNGTGQRLDVTEFVRRCLHKDQSGRIWIDMGVTRFELGDPSPGHQKELVVKYSGIRTVPEWTPPKRLELEEGGTSPAPPEPERDLSTEGLLREAGKKGRV